MGLRARLVAAHQDDGGTTLAELLVGMAVMTVFMAMFTGAVVSMTRTTTTVQAVTSTSAQVNNAFLHLDKLVRYAHAISTPATSRVNGDWHVETDSVDSDTSVETCTQLRIHAQVLQQRTWVATSSVSYTSLSAWSTLASGIGNGSAASGSNDQPFVFPTDLDSASTSFQRLQIRLTATTPDATSTSVTRGDMTFTALNSSASDTANSTTCQQVDAGTERG